MITVKVRKDTVSMELSVPELKLIQRMRQLRKLGENQLVLVQTNPLSLVVGGQLEKLEKPEVPEEVIAGE